LQIAHLDIQTFITVLTVEGKTNLLTKYPT
jgi:hypothetical protein